MAPGVRPRYRAASGFLLLLLLFPYHADSGTLLVVPQDCSQWLSMRPLVEKLGQRGHQIVLVVPETCTHLESWRHCTVKTYPAPDMEADPATVPETSARESITKRLLEGTVAPVLRELKHRTALLFATCRNLLWDRTLMEYLEGRRFDAVLTDPLFPCGPVVAEYLSLPSVYYVSRLPCGLVDSATQCPSPASYVPRPWTSHTGHMTFIQRFENLLGSPLELFLCNRLNSEYEHLASEFLHRHVGALELLSRAAVWLLKYDFVLEYPRPVMPNMVYVGGASCAHKKPLPQEFETLVNSSGEHGIVVFSLGSMVSEIPMKKAMAIAEALGTIPQTVLWRYTGPAPANLAANTKLIKWLPQNELLAHPKARAFITHAGSHGIYEGICNAVPMVLLPLFGDQMDNAKRMESRGAGVTLNVLDMTSQDLSNALKTVINDPSYKENISRLQALHLDRPIHPLDLAVHWVEFVMKHKGAPHLRSAAHDLNWIQYHSLDVIAFLLAVLSASLFIVLKCCCFCGRKCCGRTRPPQKFKSQ